MQFFIFTKSEHGDWRQYIYAAALGCLNPFAYYIVLFEAYDRLPAHVAQPLNYTWAIVLALLAIPILKQRMSINTFIGIAVSYAGIVCLITKGNWELEMGFNSFGIVLALGSSVLWATYWLVQARLKLPSVTILLTGFSFATPFLGLYCYFTVGLPSLTYSNVGYGLWIGLVEMGVTFLVWQRALAITLHAARVGQLIFLSPFCSFMVIYLVLGESIHISAIVALAMIIAGVVMVNYSTGFGLLRNK